jgi:hypothetical protein
MDVLFAVIVALGLSVGAGYYVMEWLKDYREKKLPPIEEPEDEREIPGWFTGDIERTVFTLAWLYSGDNPAYVAAGMFVWLTLKMAANWNKTVPVRGDTEDQRFAYAVYRNRWAFSGLLLGFVSMALAGFGGVVGRLIIDHASLT